MSLKSYYGCWESLQWGKTWVNPSVPTHPVPGSSRRVFLAWIHARGSLYTKQSGKVHRATETDGSGLAWSNGSHRAFGISLTQVFAYQPCHAIHYSSVWGTVPKLPNLQVFQLHTQSYKFTKNIPSYMTTWTQNWGQTFTSTASVCFLGKLACMSCDSIPDRVRKELGFMAVQVYLTVDFHPMIKLLACCWQYSLIFIIRQVHIFI